MSIVGQYQVIGPVAEANGTPALDPTHKVDLTANLRGPEGQKLSWRRLDANAEGLADLTHARRRPTRRRPPTSTPRSSRRSRQEARLVLDTKADVKVWLNGKPLDLPAAERRTSPRTVVVDLPKGTSDLLIRVAGGPAATLVTTFVADKPAGVPHRRGEGLGAVVASIHWAD